MPLEEIVGSALTRLESQLEGRPVRTDLPADLPLLSVDAVLLEQVFVNLLENAAKYTPPGSPMEIVARAGDGAIAIEVADRGPGIGPATSLACSRSSSGRRHTGSTGAGLGLAICRGVISAHGGTIVAANRTGGGAAFRMLLPIVGTPPPPAPTETSLD